MQVLLLCLVLADAGRQPCRPRLDVSAPERDVLVVRSRGPMAALQLENLAERYDYYLEWSPDRREARVLLYTAAPILRVQVDEHWDARGVLRGRTVVCVANPMRPQPRW